MNAYLNQIYVNPQDVNHVLECMLDDRVAAVGSLTRSDLHRLGQSLAQAWPVDQGPCFRGLLEAIDDADPKVRPGHDKFVSAEQMRA